MTKSDGCAHSRLRSLAWGSAQVLVLLRRALDMARAETLTAAGLTPVLVQSPFGSAAVGITTRCSAAYATTTLANGSVTIFVAVDHSTIEGVRIDVPTTATQFEALEPIRQGVRRQFRAFTAGAARLRLRPDHGRQYMSDDFQAELRFLGITSSPALTRVPEGNGVAERSIRTAEELRHALQTWRVAYNEQWLVERHSFCSQAQVRRDLLPTQDVA